MYSIDVSWPLNSPLIFTPSMVSDLNATFRFLLRVRRTQMMLASVCRVRSKRSIRSNVARSVLPEFWHLRMLLEHFVNNLQSYLQVIFRSKNFFNVLICKKKRQFLEFFRF